MSTGGAGGHISVENVPPDGVEIALQLCVAEGWLEMADGATQPIRKDRDDGTR